MMFVANLGFTVIEKTYHLLIWTNPEKTRFLLIVCILVTVFFMIIPLRIVLIAAGLAVLLPVFVDIASHFQKKIKIMPILYMFMNYLNSFPDDDQVYEVIFSLSVSSLVASTESQIRRDAGWRAASAESRVLPRVLRCSHRRKREFVACGLVGRG